jgi:hypothetical protein
MWQDESDVLFLLGDVVYSNYAMYIILSNLYLTYPITLYGRLSGNVYTGKAAKELFAVHISPNDAVYDCLEDCIREKKEIAKLWDVHKRINKIVPVSDWTDDIDSPEEYKFFFSKIELRARNDE